MHRFSYLGLDPIYAKIKGDTLVPFRLTCVGVVGESQLKLPQRKQRKTSGRAPPHKKGDAANNCQQKHEHYEHVPEHRL